MRELLGGTDENSGSSVRGGDFSHTWSPIFDCLRPLGQNSKRSYLFGLLFVLLLLKKLGVSENNLYLAVAAVGALDIRRRFTF